MVPVDVVVAPVDQQTTDIQTPIENPTVDQPMPTPMPTPIPAVNYNLPSNYFLEN